MRSGPSGKPESPARYEEMVAEAERTRKLTEEIRRFRRVRAWVASSSSGRIFRRLLWRSLASSTACPSSLPRNGIAGVIGPNGVGKTTLFKTIVGPSMAVS